jgi:protein-disulfide isomerase
MHVIRTMARLPAVLALGAVLACTSEAGQPDADSDTAVLATMGADDITVADFEEGIAVELEKAEFRFRTERYRMLLVATEQTVGQRMLEAEAEKRGTTVQQLVNEVTAGHGPTSDDVEAWYAQNQARLGGRSFGELAPQIEQMLLAQAQTRVLQGFFRELETEYDVEYLVPPLQVDFANAGAPTLGPRNAPVTIVVFSDFQCPFCRQFKQTLEQAREAYGDQIRVVFRQFPLSNHPQAFRAAEASLCAHESGKFWELHDLMFDEQDRLLEADLVSKAERVGLDAEAFRACLASGRMADIVRADLREGNSFGLTGTPQIFVNGLAASSGAVPYEALADMVDRALRFSDSD